MGKRPRLRGLPLGAGLLMLNVGARVDFGLEAVALIQVEQPNRAQRRDHFRHSLAFLGGTRADTVKYWLGKGGGDPESAVLVWVSHGEFGHGRSPLIFPLTHHGRKGCLGAETELGIVEIQGRYQTGSWQASPSPFCYLPH